MAKNSLASLLLASCCSKRFNFKAGHGARGAPPPAAVGAARAVHSRWPLPPRLAGLGVVVKRLTPLARMRLPGTAGRAWWHRGGRAGGRRRRCIKLWGVQRWGPWKRVLHLWKGRRRRKKRRRRAWGCILTPDVPWLPHNLPALWNRPRVAPIHVLLPLLFIFESVVHHGARNNLGKHLRVGHEPRTSPPPVPPPVPPPFGRSRPRPSPSPLSVPRS